MTDPPRSTDEVEALLRRTYTEVAARTFVDEATSAGEARVVSPRDRRAATWQRPIAVAAAVVLMIGGLLALIARRADAPATGGEHGHVVIGSLPVTSGEPAGFPTSFALTDVVSTDSLDRLVYASAAASVTLEVTTASGVPDGEPIEVRGVTGRRAGTSVSWNLPTGGLATLSWSGSIDQDSIDAMLDSLLYVDDDVWRSLWEHGGFREFDNAIATWRIPGDRRFEVALRGNLHDGFTLETGPSGIRLRTPATTTNRCEIHLDYTTSEFSDDPASGTAGFQVVTGSAMTTAIVHLGGQPDRVVELTSLQPTIDLAVGGLTYPDVNPNTAPTPTCEGVTP